MNYLKSLLINFLVIFFANYLLPGLRIADPSRLPHIGGDLIFALGLAFLNALIYPILRMVRHEVSVVKIILVSLILNFAAYGMLKMISLGIDVMSVEGYILVCVIAALGSFLTNYFEMKRQKHRIDMPH